MKGAGHSASALLSSADPAAPANGTPLDDGSGAPWILRLLITVLTVFFGALVWVELQIREGALLLLLVFSGLAFASFAWPRHRGLAHSFAMLIAGVVVAKLVIVTTLLVGGSLTQTAAAGDSGAGLVKGMLIGVGLMGLAAFAGWWTVSWFGLHGAGAVGQIGRHAPRRRGGLVSGGGAAPAARRDGDDGPPRPPAGGEGAARELAMDAAARLPDAHAAPGEPAAAPTAGAERVRQAREREQRHAAGDPRPDPAHGPARSTPGADDGHQRRRDRSRNAWRRPGQPRAGRYPGRLEHRSRRRGKPPPRHRRRRRGRRAGDGGHGRQWLGRAGEPSTDGADAEPPTPAGDGGRRRRAVVDACSRPTQARGMRRRRAAAASGGSGVG